MFVIQHCSDWQSWCAYTQTSLPEFFCTAKKDQSCPAEYPVFIVIALFAAVWDLDTAMKRGKNGVTSVTKQTSTQQLFSVSLECTVRELAEIIRENYEKFRLHLSYRELQMAGEGIFLNRHLTRENYRRKLPLFLSWCPMQKRVCIVSIQKWGSMDAFSICVVAKWQIWRTLLSSHKHSIPVAHTHIRAVIASCCVVDVCENESCAPQPTRHEAGEPGGHLGGPLTRDQTHLWQREHAKKEIHGTLHVSTYILASFPGSPGTQIYIARRAWYLFYVSMM